MNAHIGILQTPDARHHGGQFQSAPHADVRTRGLARLVEALEADPASTEARDWLRRALDDDEARVRLDAFKAVVRLDIGGSPDASLRFALLSGQSDVRREVLTELMSQFREGWAWTLLLERIDDPDSALRAEVLGFARQQGERREAEAVLAALNSRFREMRLAAIDVLAHRVDEVARPWLVAALDDGDEEVRTQAFRALQRTGEARAMVEALQSRHRDVRLAAATTLAEAGRSEAEEVLLTEIANPAPAEDEDPKAWARRIVLSLQGLGRLRSESVVYPARRFLDDSRTAVRRAAAEALAEAASPEVLAAVWNHEDTRVRYLLATARAWRGDATVAAAVFTGTRGGSGRVAAALALTDDEQLLAALDASHPADRALTQRVVLLLDGFAGSRSPERLIAMLTAADFSARFVAADVLDVFGDPAARRAAVVRWLSDAGDGPAWPLDASFWGDLADRLPRSDGRDQAAILGVLHGMHAATHKSQAEAEAAADKLRHDLDLVERRAEPRDESSAVDGGGTIPDLADLVLGTYVGLSSQATTPQVRAAALRRLARSGAARDPRAVQAAMRVALTDADAQVRRVAFEALPGLGVSLDDRVDEALAAGFADLGQLALNLLVDEGRIDSVWPILAERDDGLQLVAYDVLTDRAGSEATAVAALRARTSDVRAKAISALAALVEPPEAHPELVAALSSRFPDARRHAATTLAHRGDRRAFSTLVALLDDDAHQSTAIRGLVALDDPRIPDALVDRLADDPRGTADTGRILDAIGRARNPSVVDRLAALVRDEEVAARPAIDAMLVISGYDQPLSIDFTDPDADDSWLDKQHPRRDEVLAKVLQLSAEYRLLRTNRAMVRGVTWSRAADVDAPLRRLLRHADDATRQDMVAAYGWRVRYRRADAQPLHDLLAHRDPTTAFLAAEALANASASAGISVLLAAVDTLEDIRLRHRAVLALGRLADERALDKLLDIVAQEDHALVASAAQAIGHLRETEKAPEILRRLLALVEQSGPIGQGAVRGLRWFGSPEAWTAVRRAANAPDWPKRDVAIEMLRYDDSVTRGDSRRVLERLVREERIWRLLSRAAESLRRLMGPDSLEPDYVLVTARHAVETDEVLERLRERGDPARILAALAEPGANRDVYAPLLNAIAAREPFPVEAVVTHLADPRPVAVIDAARLVGRATSIDEAARSRLARSAEAAVEAWQDVVSRSGPPEVHVERVRWTLWAAARHGVAEAPVRAVLALAERDATDLQVAAARALLLLPEALDVIEQVAGQGPAEARAMAAAMIGRHAPDRVPDLLRSHRDDPAVVNALAGLPAARDALAERVDDLHIQGLVVPGFVAQPGADPEVLAGALQSAEPDVRLGALEGLAALASTEAEAHLRIYAQEASHEEEERKAAWRALRRSRRARAAREASA